VQSAYVPVGPDNYNTHTDTRKDWRIIHALQAIDSSKDY